jgi:hypothetical protein
MAAYELAQQVVIVGILLRRWTVGSVEERGRHVVPKPAAEGIWRRG